MSCQRGPIHHPSKPAFNYSGLPLGAGWLSGPDRDVSNPYFSTPTTAAHCSEFSTEIHLATYIRIYLRPQDGLTLIFFPVPPEYTSVSYYTFSFLFFSLSFIVKKNYSYYFTKLLYATHYFRTLITLPIFKRGCINITKFITSQNM